MDVETAISTLRSLLATNNVNGHQLKPDLKLMASEAIGDLETWWLENKDSAENGKPRSKKKKKETADNAGADAGDGPDPDAE